MILNKNKGLFRAIVAGIFICGVMDKTYQDHSFYGVRQPDEFLNQDNAGESLWSSQIHDDFRVSDVSILLLMLGALYSFNIARKEFFNQNDNDGPDF